MKARTRGIAGLAALAAAGLVLSGCVTRTDVRMAGEPGVRAAGGWGDDRGAVQVISALIGGKNVFIPSTLVVVEGSGRQLSFFNTTDIPHGMTIPALDIAVVLPPGEEFVVALPPLGGGQLYDIGCHLHPPHRHATLVVLPAR